MQDSTSGFRLNAEKRRAYWGGGLCSAGLQACLNGCKNIPFGDHVVRAAGLDLLGLQLELAQQRCSSRPNAQTHLVCLLFIAGSLGITGICTKIPACLQYALFMH